MNECLAVDLRYPNKRLSGAEWAADRIVVIPAETRDADLAKVEVREALEWLIANLDVSIRHYDEISVYNLGYLQTLKIQGEK